MCLVYTGAVPPHLKMALHASMSLHPLPMEGRQRVICLRMYVGAGPAVRGITGLLTWS
jgi:hypothetical protein